ncbi:IgGFc-binding protein [Empedobacter falsenii]
MKTIYQLFLFINILISQTCYSQLDNIHYLQPLVFGDYASSVTQEFIYLSTPSKEPITVEVTYPDEISSPRLLVVNLSLATKSYVSDGLITLSNEQPVRISFVNTSNSILKPGLSAVSLPTNRAGTIIKSNEGGLVFKSKESFYVNYRARHTGHAGTVLTKGKVALGKTFLWGGTPNEFSNTTSNIGTMLSFTATEDNTEVVVDNYEEGLEFLNGNGLAPIIHPTISVNLNKGESYILYAKMKKGAITVQNNGWLGARIQSSKQISVTVGGLLQQGGKADNRDIGLDQIIPIQYVGTEYIIMQGNGSINNERVIVIATEEDTKITVNESTIENKLTKIGDYLIVPGSNFMNKNMYISSDKPVYVFHKVFGSSGFQTNNFMLIPPTSCNGQNSVDLIPDAKTIGDTSYPNTILSVLARKGDSFKPIIELNNEKLSESEGPTNVPGNSDWVSYRYAIGSKGLGNIKISALGTIQAQILGASGDAGFGGYYSGFGIVPELKVIIKNKRNDLACTGDTGISVLQSELNQFSGTYQWYKNGKLIPGATTITYDIPYKDTESADYFMTVTLNDGCIYFSEIITTYACPYFKPFNPEATDTNSVVGISTTETRTTPLWTNDIPNAFLVLESKNKGLVISRNKNPEKNILLPVRGMILYDSDDKCIKLYNGTKWSCIKQKCYDYE